MARTLAIGLDGSSWNVLEPLLDDGVMPNLAALRERGARGVLESTIPFYTGPAWASFATACSPAAHGIYDFTMLRDGDQMSVARQSDLRRLTYYEQLAREGRRSVLVNLPLDQQEAEGCVIVNSWLTVDESRRVYPLDRRERYASELAAYQNYPTTFRADLETHLDELCHIERQRFELAKALFEGEEWHHFFILFSATDWLGHYATGLFLEGDPAARRAFGRLYAELDGYVGWLCEHAPDATVAILSDHGQCEETHAVHLNGLLRDLGFVSLLRERSRDVNAAVSGAQRTVRVPAALGRLRRSTVLRPLVRRAKDVLRRRGVDLVTPQHGGTVDRVVSRAFTPTTASYAVYTHDCTPAELDGIREAMLDLRLDDGRAVFDGVWTFEELYGRPAPAGAPTFVFAPALGVRPSTHVRSPFVERAAEHGRGAHQRDGFVVLAGPHVRTCDLGMATLYDVVPTLMWSAGSGVPADVDGRVLYEAFEQDFADSQELHEVQGGDVEREETGGGDGGGEVAARLRALGYI
jgi:predicted AlkP superfamily phosphohydrolase/phosphomutase